MRSKDASLFAVGQRVRLKLFNGTVSAAEDCRPADNYWLLIGQDAEVVAPKNEKQRLLVKFSVSSSSSSLISRHIGHKATDSDNG
jgi:hypothetical protein